MHRVAFTPESHPSQILTCKTLSRTKQEFKDESDINNIMKQYVNYGVLPTPARNAMYGDFTQFTDLLDAQLQVKDAENLFNMLPATVRERFKNDPNNLLTFIADSNNREEAINLGLITKPEPAPEPPATNKPETKP